MKLSVLLMAAIIEQTLNRPTNVCLRRFCLSCIEHEAININLVAARTETNT